MDREQLRSARKVLGVTQSLVARRANVDRTRLVMFENDYAELRPEELARVEQFMREQIMERERQLAQMRAQETING